MAKSPEEENGKITVKDDGKAFKTVNDKIKKEKIENAIKGENVHVSKIVLDGKIRIVEILEIKEEIHYIYYSAGFLKEVDSLAVANVTLIDNGIAENVRNISNNKNYFVNVFDGAASNRSNIYILGWTVNGNIIGRQGAI